MEFSLPTETIELPSKGTFYKEGHPLASGTVEMKYMTAKEEDILTNQNYIKKGVVIDKLLKSLLVTDFDYGDILVGDKNAIMIAARILSYGKDYAFTYNGEQHSVDLSLLDNKKVDHSSLNPETGEFMLALPKSKYEVGIKLLAHSDEQKIEQEVSGLRKINKDNIAEVTTRLKHLIVSINGSRERADIRKFVDSFLLAQDAKAIRDHYNKVQPDINLKFSYEGQNGVEQEATIPIGVDFFWPDFGE
jgi:hypothetical protein